MRDDITNIAIEDYLTALMPPRQGVLNTLEQVGHARGLPLVGPVEGQFLYLLAKMSGARDALEIGVATGYAALWLLHARSRGTERKSLSRTQVLSIGVDQH